MDGKRCLLKALAVFSIAAAGSSFVGHVVCSDPTCTEATENWATTTLLGPNGLDVAEQVTLYRVTGNTAASGVIDVDMRGPAQWFTDPPF